MEVLGEAEGSRLRPLLVCRFGYLRAYAASGDVCCCWQRSKVYERRDKLRGYSNIPKAHRMVLWRDLRSRIPAAVRPANDSNSSSGRGNQSKDRTRNCHQDSSFCARGRRLRFFRLHNREPEQTEISAVSACSLQPNTDICP